MRLFSFYSENQKIISRIPLVQNFIIGNFFAYELKHS
jgi:hypothetical protein